MDHRDNNLNLLRILAAFFVLYEHSFALSGRHNPSSFLGEGFGTAGVAIFFIISGYLISASYISNPSLVQFLWNRILRIFPGLIVVTLISIFVFGPILTALDLSNYFNNPGTWFYLWNIGLFPVFALPGVLEHAPVANALNGSLWTLPLEFALYITVIVLGLIAALNKKSYALFFIIYLIFYSFAKSIDTPWVKYGTDWRLFVTYGIYFYMGAGFRIFGFRGGTLGWSLLAMLSLSILIAAPSLWIVVLKIFALTYIVLSTGLASSSLGSWINKQGDYSYGFYIYAFPIQQILFSKTPWLGMPVYIMMCSFITLVFAWISWHFVENKALRLKNIKFRDK